VDNKPIIPDEWQATTPNRAYLDLCLRNSAQIQPDGWTLDMLGTLGDISEGE